MKKKKEKHKFEGVFKHLVYTHEDFSEFDILTANYEENDRFSALKYLN